MEYPIADVKTDDGVVLQGLFLKAKNSRSVLIFIHGTASNFYENDFMVPISKELLSRKISILSVNNRGNEVLKCYPGGGASMEHFEDCVHDIDAWIKFALSEGCANVILMGHSLGAEKIVYYMSKGKHKNNVISVILLGPADSYGTQMKYGNGSLMSEAKRLGKSKNGHIFLTSDWLSHAGVLPKAADSYLNFFSANSELSKVLPFHSRKLKMYGNIRVPILSVLGDIEKGKGHEYTVIPIIDAIRLLKKENPHAECHQIKDCNHDFEGKEVELTKIIGKFLLKIKSLKAF